MNCDKPHLIIYTSHDIFFFFFIITLIFSFSFPLATEYDVQNDEFSIVVDRHWFPTQFSLLLALINSPLSFFLLPLSVI